MNRWIKAVWYDLVFQEHKQQLTRLEKIDYNIYMAGLMFGCAIVSMFFVSGWFFLVPVAFTLTGARKVMIYWNKKKQWDEDNIEHKADV